MTHNRHHQKRVFHPRVATWVFALSIPCVLNPLEASAQDDEQESKPTSVPDTEKAEEDNELGGQIDAIMERLDRAEKEAALEKEENKNLKENVEELTSRLEMIETENDMEFEFAGTESLERKLDIYGFMDVNFFYWDADKNTAPYGIFPKSTSFIVNRLNIYFSSQMTETLSALTEIRFTFLPLGQETAYDVPAIGMEYERKNTSTTSNLTLEEFNLGGLSIERVYLQWTPFNWLSVRVGHYLTPFGIWNEDHGSPVIIPVRHPYLLLWESVPLAQTGIQIFGRFFPAEGLYLDYAITLSNGRGPTDTVYDLDNNKALGLRLKASYERKFFELAIGGYLYYGETTDVTKAINEWRPLKFEVIEKENYTEITGTLDLMLRFHGFRMQTEYARGQIKYSKRPIYQLPVLHIDNVFGEYQPDFVRWAFYALVSYSFPFKTTFGEMSITPYFMYENSNFDDTNPNWKIVSYTPGLNFRPSPFVVIKYESTFADFPDSPYFEGGLWVHSAQVAVAF